MPSSSLVEVKDEVGVEVEVEVEVEVGVEFEVEVGFLRCNLDLRLVVVSTFTGGWSGGWVGGWSKVWRVMLNSTQNQKLKFELSLAKLRLPPLVFKFHKSKLGRFISPPCGILSEILPSSLKLKPS